MSFNFMTAVIIRSDFWAQENKIHHRFHFLHIYFQWNNGTGCHDGSFLKLSFKPTFSFSSFTFIKRLCRSSSLSAMSVVSSTYLRLLFLLPILILAYASSSPAFLMMCSGNTLKQQKALCTSFLTMNQSVVPYRVLTVASWPAHRFLRRQVRRSGVPISLRLLQFVMIYNPY